MPNFYDCIESKRPFRERLELLSPKVVLLLCDYKLVVDSGEDVLLRFKQIELIKTIHPATPPDIYEREKGLRVAWNQVLEYLNR